jgi:hypothetical protein
LPASCASTCFVMILYVKVHGERRLLRCAFAGSFFGGALMLF